MNLQKAEHPGIEDIGGEPLYGSGFEDQTPDFPLQREEDSE